MKIMKKFKCSQETTGFMFCKDTSGKCAWDANGYHRVYGFGMYLYCYMSNGNGDGGRGYGTDNFKWGKGGQVNVFFEEYPHHLIII